MQEILLCWAYFQFWMHFVSHKTCDPFFRGIYIYIILGSIARINQCIRLIRDCAAKQFSVFNLGLLLLLIIDVRMLPEWWDDPFTLSSFSTLVTNETIASKCKKKREVGPLAELFMSAQNIREYCCYVHVCAVIYTYVLYYVFLKRYICQRSSFWDNIDSYISLQIILFQAKILHRTF